MTPKLAPLQLLTQATTLDSFFETAQTHFGNEQELSQVISDLRELENLSHLSTNLAADRAYLRQMKDSLPSDADSLLGNIDTALADFNLEKLLSSSSSQDALRSQLDQLKSDYANQYRIYWTLDKVEVKNG